MKRSLVPPQLAELDLADTDASCPVRFTTIVPTQALDELFAVVLRIRGILHLLTTALGATTLLLRREALPELAAAE